jgi:hypothetical protein
MNALIGALSDLIERTAEPADDLGLSEADSLRLNLLLEDPAFVESFANTALEPDDIEQMSAYAWVWYLQWRSTHAEPPSGDFLSALYDSTEDPLVRNGIVESVVLAARYAQTTPSTPPEDWEIHDIPMPWIRQQFLVASASVQAGGDVELPYSRFDDRQRAADIVPHLLEFGDEYSIGAIRAFLHADPPNRAAFTAQALEWISETDGKIRSDWLRLLGLPNTPPTNTSDNVPPDRETF